MLKGRSLIILFELGKEALNFRARSLSAVLGASPGRALHPHD